MIKISLGGITMEVNEKDLQPYLTAGYKVVKDVQPKAEKAVEPAPKAKAQVKPPKK